MKDPAGQSSVVTAAIPTADPSKTTTETIGNIGLTFLGTAAAQPSATRNHSSLALHLGGDVWLFDCGEATQHQIQRSDTVKVGKIKKIFVTHTHGGYFQFLPQVHRESDWQSVSH